jgi:cytochrome bd-type quinol oxidase subunit 2
MSEEVRLMISLFMLFGLIYSSGYYMHKIKPATDDSKQRFRAWGLAFVISSIMTPITLGEVIFKKLKGVSIYE